MNFNNNMKQVLHILLTLLLLFTFSCNDDNVNNDNNSILIGSWGDAACSAWRKATVDEIIEHFKNR